MRSSPATTPNTDRPATPSTATSSGCARRSPPSKNDWRQPTEDTLSPEQRRARRKAKAPKGYPTQAERFQKQRRLQQLRAKLDRVTTDWDNNRVRVVEGAKRLAKTRHNLNAAKLTVSGWREEWDSARDRIEAKGSGDEPFGNLTITVTPDGQVSLRLPNPLEHLANAPRRPLHPLRQGGVRLPRR